MTGREASDFAGRLRHRLVRQGIFCHSSSPLYARLFAHLATWLEQDDERGVWLRQAAQGRAPFDVPLLLASGLHFLVLSGQVGDDVSAFYPSVGGALLPDAPGFEEAIDSTVAACRPFLAQWLATVSVQTNETGRGLGWLLPLVSVPWRTVALLDIGASAGLNLVADKRSYQLRKVGSAETDARLGAALQEQFVINWSGRWAPPAVNELPYICQRLACDRQPVRLQGEDDECRLMAFVWPDQLSRLQRLREGIAAFHGYCHEEGALPHFQVELPGELPDFLPQLPWSSTADALLLFSSYIRNYLADPDDSLFAAIEGFALTQQRPVCWIQHDLPSSRHPVGEPPVLGWVLWHIDVWQSGQHHSFPLAWCHPHGSEIQWLPGIQQWQHFHKNLSGLNM